MEMIIGILVLGLIGIVVMFFKFSSEEAKQQKNLEDAKSRKISDLEASLARKDIELKKLMEERQKLEDDFFKAKDDADIAKRENADLVQKAKQAEKLKEESAALKQENKQKEAVYQQEVTARQKLQGELALLETELEKIKKQLKEKAEIYDGLKGQYDELGDELQRLQKMRMQEVRPAEEKSSGKELPPPEPLRPDVQKTERAVKPEPLKSASTSPAPPAVPPATEKPRIEPAKTEPAKVSSKSEAEKPREESSPLKIEPPKAAPKPEVSSPVLPATERPKPEAGEGKDAKGDGKTPPEPPKKDAVSEVKAAPEKPPAQKPHPIPSAAESVKKEDEIPGFPKKEAVKLDAKKDVPSDTDFLKAGPAQKETQAPPGVEVPPGAFKLTPPEKPHDDAGVKKQDKVAGDQNPPAESRKPASQTLPEEKIEKTKPSQNKEEDKPSPKPPDKEKSKRETLIPGFHPKDQKNPE